MNEVLHDPSDSGHSRWGRDDQLGAGNLLTQERRLSALRSIQTGALYDLSHEINPRAPFLTPNQTPFLQSIWASWRDSIKRRRLEVSIASPALPAAVTLFRLLEGESIVLSLLPGPYFR
jgi:hypothetical protein